jgi:hypothetical protein
LASVGLADSTKIGRKSSRSTADSRSRSRRGALLGREHRIQFRREGAELLARQRADEGFHCYFGLAQAGSEIVVQAFELVPGVAGLHGDPGRDVFGRVVIFAGKLLHGLRQNSQLLKIARAAGEKDAVEKFVPGGRGLRSFTAEVLCVQRFHIGNIADVAAAVGEHAACTCKRSCQTR